MKTQDLDSFEDVSGWSAVASGQAELKLASVKAPSGSALRMDFDFKGGGGFVVARKLFRLVMPEAYAFRFQLRGRCPANHLEFKLVDSSGKNVWREQWKNLRFPVRWREMCASNCEIEFAWGPAGGGALTEPGAIEFAIVAGKGGKGSVWITDLRFEDHSVQSAPVLRASSEMTGHEAGRAMDGVAGTSWCPRSDDPRPWIALDFHEKRELGGVIVDWKNDAPARGFRLRGSNDGRRWKALYTARKAAGAHSYLFLPHARARHLRLDLMEAGSGVAEIRIQPFEFSRSINSFFHALAECAPRGWHPKWLHREQSLWTLAGLANGTRRALLNEEGMVEIDEGSFSIEPFLFIDQGLVTWADVSIHQSLEEGWLPVPSVTWKAGTMSLQITAWATEDGPRGTLQIRYRVHNNATSEQRVRLFAAVRPFQVTPPWQSFRTMGGVSPIHDLAISDDVIWVNGERALVTVTTPSGFGALPFDEGTVLTHLARGEVPAQSMVHDEFGCASGALAFDLVVPPHGERDVHLAVPFGLLKTTDDALLKSLANESHASQGFAETLRRWQEKLASPRIHGAGTMGDAVSAMHTAAAHILITRDGPALQPGPRRYTRSWIRDGAIMSAALLQMGYAQEVREFIRWYAPHQREDGFVPCCVDRDGIDWLVEHDSHGQLIYAIAEYFRFTGDCEFLEEMWPAVLKAAGFLERLRQQRLTPEYEQPEKRAALGLLPESVSHEGYLSQPVHSYWDDFWALRGLRDAAAIARVLGEKTEASRLRSLCEEFGDTLRASIQAVRTHHQLDYIPGSVEWADFDPTATANAITLLHLPRELPSEALAWTFKKYLADFRKKHRGEMDWLNYSPYEIRIIGAMVRLGRRDDALELLKFFLSDRRPLAWNQWPEIAWHDPKAPAHLGDLPHTWIAAEYILAVRSMLAFESEADQTLVLAAGVAPEWITGDGVRVSDLPTWHGPLSYSLRTLGEDTFCFEIGGSMKLPVGGIVLRPPLPRPICRVTVNGEAAPFKNMETTISQLPARVLIHCAAPASNLMSS